jgi:hypothetical protein
MYEPLPFPDCRVEQVTHAGPERVETAVQAGDPIPGCLSDLLDPKQCHAGAEPRSALARPFEVTRHSTLAARYSLLI